MKIPEQLLSVNSYPTEELLNFVENYQPSKEVPLKKFLDILHNGWTYADWGFKLKRKSKKEYILELHTAGWSGNEDLINSLMSNKLLVNIYIQPIKWHTGGHYYFKISSQYINEKNN